MKYFGYLLVSLHSKKKPKTKLTPASKNYNPSTFKKLFLCVFIAHLLLVNLSFWSPLCLITRLVPRRA